VGLPAGITISTAGIISGAPTTAGAAGTATITVTHSATPTPASRNIVINVGAVSSALPAEISVTNITETSATLSARASPGGSGHWLVVPRGSARPTQQQVTNSFLYPGTVIASGFTTSPLTDAFRTLTFLMGLTPGAGYDVYLVVLNGSPTVVWAEAQFNTLGARSGNVPIPVFGSGALALLAGALAFAALLMRRRGRYS
jgi:hypothetical protein